MSTEAHEEAERRYPFEAPDDPYRSDAERLQRNVFIQGERTGWIDHAEWQASRPVTDAEVEAAVEALSAEIHEAWEFQYDECDHGIYHGGHLNGEPYAMCKLTADRIIRRRVAARTARQEATDAEH